MIEHESDRHSILRAIEEGEANLRRIAEEHAAVAETLVRLKAQLAAANVAEASTDVVVPESPGPSTPEEKVALFRNLFRGRPDVYPTRFESVRTGKPGYAPACSNKFRPGVCDLPRVKCGECTNQAFRPVDDASIRGHLRGEHVMGVYPMLADETCWFLAVDFDKGTWKDDARAFAATCRRLRLPVAVERSRSGNGAHVWFFFAAPVAASLARKMACHVITETMGTRHELGMESYDRLFPSQDTMPRGGFGNLIALPLQYEARKQNNSVFLDEEMNPFSSDKQWAFLAAIERIPPSTVERVAAEASRAGTVLGVRNTDDEGEDEKPWTRRPSNKQRTLPALEPLRESVNAVLAQRLFVEKAGLPSPLLNQIKRLAAFQNPEFYKKQSMRLSTALTPRVIACAEDLPHHVALPRGCKTELESLLDGLGVRLQLIDERCIGSPLTVAFKGQLTAIQDRAARAILAHEIGVFVAPPGVGKTVVGTYLVAARACSTLILVHRQPLLDQWIAQLSVFLGIEPRDIGQIGAGKRRANGQLDVAMIQSLVRKESVDDILAHYGHVIVDECHHLPAVSFERVLSNAKARYVTGLTATRLRRDGHHPITQMQLGPVRFTVDAKSQAEARPFAHWLFVRETSFRSNDVSAASIQNLYGALARNADRNELIISDVIRALEEGRSPILLTERKDHLEFFAAKLRSFAKHIIVLHGGMGAKAQREVQARMAAIPANEERLVLATGRYIGEGFDDARLDTLFLTLPVSWKGTLTQYAGRLHRLHPGKREVQIFDYVDREVPMLLRMFEKRLRGYRAIGYARGDAPLGFGEVPDDPVIEYDDDDATPASDDLFS